MNAAPLTAGAEGWKAELRLRFEPSSDTTRTRLARRWHRGPLLVQRPFYPEGGPCHVYVVHPPGGVVGGDELRVDVQVEPKAQALITTPAATKFYRCERPAALSQELRVDDGDLEWLPQENILYPGADVRAVTRVQLRGSARFIGWELGCLGLPARGQPFDRGRAQLDFELWDADTPRFIDRLRLAGDSAARGGQWGLGGCEALGTLLATPATSAMVDALRALPDLPDRAGVTLVDRVLVMRALGAQAADIQKIFIAAWRALRPMLLDRAPTLPRIWAT